MAIVDAPRRSSYSEAYVARRSRGMVGGARGWSGLGQTLGARLRSFDPALGAFGQWFAGGRISVCHNALDRHVDAGRGQQPALIWDSPASGGQKRVLSYEELRDATARLAGALAAAGVVPGDRVIIYMPMVPEVVMAMLACARLGAVHSVVFGGFAAAELAKRIEDAQPRAVVCASCGIEPGRLVAYKPLLDQAIAMSAHKPERCLVLQRPMLRADLMAGRDSDLLEMMRNAEPHPCVLVAATDPLYILYTSGTTGKSKGVVRDCGGYAVALHASMGMIYGVGAGDVYWCASDVGWVVGHSYIVYGPLLAGCTTVLYEGKPVGTPDAGAFWRVCEEHGVRVLFTAPTALRAIKQLDSDGTMMRGHDLSRLEALYLAGERCDPRRPRSGPPSAWAFPWWTTGGRPRPVGPSPQDSEATACSRPGPGRVGGPVRATWSRRLMTGAPCCPAATRAISRSGCRFHRAAGRRCGTTRPAIARHIWRTFRAGTARVTRAGSTRRATPGVMGRTDDIINVASHRLSTGAIEEVLAVHPDVAESAVIGAADSIKGQVAVGLVVLKAGCGRDEAEVSAELVALVRERIGPVAAFKTACVVARLPKTRSGKILRASIRRIADGQPPLPPPTIDDPAALEEVATVLSASHSGLIGRHCLLPQATLPSASEERRRAGCNEFEHVRTDVAVAVREAAVEQVGVSSFEHADLGAHRKLQGAADDDAALISLVLEHGRPGVGTGLVALE